MTLEQLKCLLGFHDWEWKRMVVKNVIGEECGWAEGMVCKKCGKKKIT